MKLSIIIVHYNVAKLLRGCLISIQKYSRNVQLEVIVIDNLSPDPSWLALKTEFPQVKFIASAHNEGFAVANNRGVELAKGEYILLLNPDTEFEGFYLNDILNFTDQKLNFGCLGVRMHDFSGRFLPESKRSVPNMVNSFQKLFTGFRKNNVKSYYRSDICEFEVAEVEVLTGAFLLMKKKIYQDAGGLDESYFMYGEDIDLCYTLLNRGYKNWYYGKASILHHKGESTVKNDVYLQRFYGAMQIFLDKYYKKQKPVQYAILSAGLHVRHLIEKLRQKKKEI